MCAVCGKLTSNTICPTCENELGIDGAWPHQVHYWELFQLLHPTSPYSHEDYDKLRKDNGHPNYGPLAAASITAWTKQFNNLTAIKPQGMVVLMVDTIPNVVVVPTDHVTQELEGVLFG